MFVQARDFKKECMGFLKKAFNDVVQAVSPVAEIISNPVAQIKAVDDKYLGSTVNNVSGGLVSSASNSSITSFARDLSEGKSLKDNFSDALRTSAVAGASVVAGPSGGAIANQGFASGGKNLKDFALNAGQSYLSGQGFSIPKLPSFSSTPRAEMSILDPFASNNSGYNAGMENNNQKKYLMIGGAVLLVGLAFYTLKRK